MSNKEKYDQSFVDAFMIDQSELSESLKYNSIEAWDSIGHLGLMSELEEAFDISMETDDIVDFSSYKKGVEILAKYGVEIHI